MTTSNKTIRTSTLFEERVGTCTIAMCLDKRHPDDVNKNSYPLCIRFTIYDSRYYYRLGEKCTQEEMTKLSKALGNREKRIGLETTFERKVRLQEVFTSMVNVVTTVRQLRFSQSGRRSSKRNMVWAKQEQLKTMRMRIEALQV